MATYTNGSPTGGMPSYAGGGPERRPGLNNWKIDPEALERRKRNAQSLQSLVEAQRAGRDPGVQLKDPTLFDENGLPRNGGNVPQQQLPGNGNPGRNAGRTPYVSGAPALDAYINKLYADADAAGAQAKDYQGPGGSRVESLVPGQGAAAPTAGAGDYDPYADYRNINGNGQTSPDYWQQKLAELRGRNAAVVDPSQEWGDDRWRNSYHTNDTVEVKADGNEHFGQKWDPTANGGQGAFVDIDVADKEVESMFAESKGWEEDYRRGMEEAWTNNDEEAFQRWRNLGRANAESKWKIPETAKANPAPKNDDEDDRRSGPVKPPKPTSPAYQRPTGMPVRQNPVY